jgi:RHS repeat-associated protein
VKRLSVAPAIAATRIAAIAIALAFLALAPHASAQQDFETLKKGFQPERLYHFAENGFDSVNVYNGNLILPIGIGLTYPLNGGFTYGITLAYNSTVWMQTEGPGGTVHAVPSLRANAGAGWLIGLGRFVAHDDVTTDSPGTDRYEAPDGGDHSFDAFHADDTNCGTIGCPTYTTDGSNLRLRKISTTVIEIDAPDGVTREFTHQGQEWRLTKIRSANSNDTVTVSHFAGITSSIPCTAPSNSYTLVHDSQGRDHYICYRTDAATDGYGLPIVSEVFVSPIQGQAPARYTFSYHVSTVQKAVGIDNDTSTDWSSEHEIPILDKLTLPDGSSYSFSNFDAVANRDIAQLKKVTLPTGGVVSYQYDLIGIPSLDLCASAYAELAIGYGFASKNIGVVSRTFTPVVPAGRTATPQTWGYGDRTFLPSGGYMAVKNCNAGNPNATPTDIELFDEMVVDVVDPDGGKTWNHFSVWPGHDTGRNATNGGGSPDVSPAGFTRANYSFPYGVYDSTLNLYLSQEILYCAAECVKREVWVRHDTDPPLTPDDVPPHRLASQRTIFRDDCVLPGICHWTQMDSSEWDGYGHYRTVATSSDFGGGGDARTVTTSWNKAAGVPRVIGKSSNWILNTYEDVVTTEGGDTAREQACFDTATGFLRGKRVLAGTTPAGTDLVSVLEKELSSGVNTGNVATESSYGGDLTPFPHIEAQLCSALAAMGGNETPAYRQTHTWQNGHLQSTQTTGIPFKNLDLTIDASGLISASTDPTGRVTTYGYDRSGRLTAVAAPEAAPTSYVYGNATVSLGQLTQPATVRETTTSSQGAGTLQREYQFDSFGRFWREKQLSPAGLWSVREILYDRKNRKASVSAMEQLVVPPGGSELGFSPQLPRTQTFYDLLDRPTKTIAPDLTETLYSYTGTRVRTQSVTVGTSAGSRIARTREDYDGKGRLASVREAYDAFGDVTTNYGYDVGGRLKTVRAPAGTDTQERTFTYDHRGLLIDEQHPELGANGNGTAHYSEYDARGHAHRRTVGPFDLRMMFDAAERVTAISDAVTNAPWKQFAFDGTDAGAFPQCTNNRCMGKVAATARWNYDPILGTIAVTEGYAHDGFGGRPSRRDVAIGSVPNQFSGLTLHHAQTYNDLGLVASLVYPCHPAGAACTGDGPSIPLTYANGRLSAVGSYSPSITYLPNGMVGTVTHGTGSGQTVDTSTPDPSGIERPLRIRTTNAATGTELWSSGDYAYDGSGNVTRMGTTRYSYDLFGRLSSFTSDLTRAGSGYTYDRFGNRLATTFGFCSTNPDGTVRCGGTTSSAEPIVGTTNHYQDVSYDAAGNVTADRAGARTFAYDSLGMMTRAQATGRDFHFLYTADDERVAVVERVGSANRTTWSIRNFGNELLTVWTDDATSGTRSITWKEDEIRRGSLLLANVTPAAAPKHYTLDHLGSPRLVNDSTGAHAQDFDPFGNGGLLGSGALQFTGHERDRANVGSGTADLPDYLHARSYEPTAGRFLSVDPVVELKPSIKNPQGWNRYAYVRNNPMRYADPTGKYTCNGSKEECATFAQALADAKTASANLAANSAGRAKIETTLIFYGPEGKKNGVKVTFTNDRGVVANTVSSGFLMFKTTTVTVNLRNIASIVAAHPGSTVASENAAVAIHEGTHGKDERLGVPDRGRSDELGYERRAYETQASVNEGLGTDSAWNLWTNAGGINQAAIEEAAQASTNQACSNGCPP